MIIYTDHAAIRRIASQTSLQPTSIEKPNLRLIRASEYLQRFKLNIKHIAGKENIILDAMSRLKVKKHIANQRTLKPNYLELDPLDALHGAVDIIIATLWNLGAQIFHTTTVQLSIKLKDRVQKSHVKDDHHL